MKGSAMNGKAVKEKVVTKKEALGKRQAGYFLCFLRFRVLGLLFLAWGLLAASPAFCTAPENPLDAEALRRFCASGAIEELRSALQTASADEPFPDGNRPLHVAAEHASDPRIVTLLLEAGGSLSSRGLEDLTPLMLAAAYNPNAPVAEALLKAGSDLSLIEVEIGRASCRERV